MFYHSERWRPFLPALVQTLACLVAFAVGLPSLGFAQGRTSPSQRLLPLPESGPSDLPTQFRLLQELQRLMQSESTEKTGSSRNEDRNSGEDRNSHEDLLEQWKKDLSPQQLEAMEDLVKQFPGLAQSFENGNTPNPQSPQQLSHVRQLLEQYQKTRRLPAPSPGSQTGKQPGLLPPSHSGQGSPETEDSTALEDLMRRTSDDPKSLPPLSIPPYLNKDNAKPTSPSAVPPAVPPAIPEDPGRSVKSESVPESPTSRANNAKRVEIQEKLNTKGLEGTWRELVQQAQREAKNQPLKNSPTSSSGGTDGGSNWFDIDTKVLQSLDGAKDELLKIAQEAASSRGRKPATGSAPPPPLPSAPLPSAPLPSALPVPPPNANFGSGPPPPQTSPGQKGFPGESFLKGVGDMFRNVTDTTKDVATTSPLGSSDWGASSLASAVEWLFFVGLAGVAMFVWLRRNRSTDANTYLVRSTSIAPNVDVKDRADIVLAFHQMVATAKIPAETWWPHRRAATALVAAKPELDSPAQVLSRLYELARYLPADQTFSESQIQDARRAVEQLRAC